MFDLGTIKRMNEGAWGRQSLSAMMEGVAHAANPKPAIACYNVAHYTAPNGDKVWRQRYTDIVTLHADGTATLDSGGWNTVTTKRKINEFSKARLYQRRRVWYIDGRDGKPVEFYDGIKIDADGFPINAVETVAA